MNATPPDAIAFAEKALALLDQGSYTATYKYAVLLALLDTCLEGADRDGHPPTRVHPRALAERVVELYWPQTSPYSLDEHPAVVLRQNHGGQAVIIQLIRTFRDQVEAAGVTSLAHARHAATDRYARLVDEVAWKLVQMPLPRLQRFGHTEDRFLYDLDWDEHISRGRFERGEVDPYLRLQPGVGDHLVRLAGLLRPLVQRQWADHVVALNHNDIPALDHHHDLDQFLFGAVRADLSPVRADLRDLQARACFYCGDRLTQPGDVDHFLPWSRHPDDGIHNLVVAHPRCNNHKRDFLAATPHVQAWTERFHDAQLHRSLDDLAAARNWTVHPDRTLSVARAVYLRLPEQATLWLVGTEFTTPDRAALAAALGAAEPQRPAAEEPGAFEADE